MSGDYFKSKIAIGTAQFGLNYGIANYSGKISQTQMRRILKLAIKNGINTIETAQSYGSSEKKLGKININKFKIITKLPINAPKKGFLLTSAFFRASSLFNSLPTKSFLRTGS